MTYQESSSPETNLPTFFEYTIFAGKTEKNEPIFLGASEKTGEHERGATKAGQLDTGLFTSPFKLVEYLEIVLLLTFPFVFTVESLSRRHQ